MSQPTVPDVPHCRPREMDALRHARLDVLARARCAETLSSTPRLCGSIVRRVKPTPGSQLALFARYSYHGFITDPMGRPWNWRPTYAVDLKAAHAFSRSGTAARWWTGRTDRIGFWPASARLHPAPVHSRPQRVPVSASVPCCVFSRIPRIATPADGHRDPVD